MYSQVNSCSLCRAISQDTVAHPTSVVSQLNAAVQNLSTVRITKIICKLLEKS